MRPRVSGAKNQVNDGPDTQAFLAHAEHQPAGATLNPGNSTQAPVAAVKNWQLAQVLPGLRAGGALAASST